jgi:hypothetical protein
VFLMASVPSGSKMHKTSAAHEIHAALHFDQKAKCTQYTLLDSITFCSQDE